MPTAVGHAGDAERVRPRDALIDERHASKLGTRSAPLAAGQKRTPFSPRQRWPKGAGGMAAAERGRRSRAPRGRRPRLSARRGQLAMPAEGEALS
jgi:hypothetical protein